MGKQMTIAVLSGPERRRRWTTAEKLRLVKETLTPEANIAAIARRHDVHPNLLHAWRRQARTRLLAGEVACKPVSGEEVRFAAVAIAPERPAAVAPSAGGMIETDLINLLRRSGILWALELIGNGYPRNRASTGRNCGSVSA